MEGDFYFESTPVAPPGTAMLMYARPENRSTFGHNAKKAWYIGPYLNHYRTFKAIIPSTGAERMSDTVKMKHHAIATPTLTPADRILETARQLDNAIKQQPKSAPMDELTTIDLLREVLLGKKRKPLPHNSVQLANKKQQTTPHQQPTQMPTPPAQPPETAPAAPAQSPTASPSSNDTNYVRGVLHSLFMGFYVCHFYAVNRISMFHVEANGHVNTINRQRPPTSPSADFYPP